MNELLIAGLTEEIKELNRKLDTIGRQVFDARGAAEYMTVSYDTLLRLARIGNIEHVKNGSSYIFKKEYLDRWLDKNKVRVN